MSWAALGTASSGCDSAEPLPYPLPAAGPATSSPAKSLSTDHYLISALLVTFSRSRHSSEFMCANGRITSHLHVPVGLFQPSFLQQRSPRVWAGGAQCPQQSLGLGVQQDVAAVLTGQLAPCPSSPIQTHCCSTPTEQEPATLPPVPCVF